MADTGISEDNIKLLRLTFLTVRPALRSDRVIRYHRLVPRLAVRELGASGVYKQPFSTYRKSAEDDFENIPDFFLWKLHLNESTIFE